MTVLTDNFAADTGQLNVYALNGATAGSAAITGGQLIMTAPGPPISGVGVGENAWSIPVTSLFVSVKLGVPTWGRPASSQNNYGPGIIKDGNNHLWFTAGPAGSTTTLVLNVFGVFAGSHIVFSNPVITSLTLPDFVGFALNGNIITAYLSYAGVWQKVGAIGNVNVGAFHDFTAPGGLTGWNPGIYWETGIASSTDIATAQLQFTQPFVDPVTATVPNVVGETQAQAQSDILAANLTVGSVTFTFSSMVPDGDVISQNPSGGTVVTEQSPVDLIVSSASIVPSVINLSLAIAEATLAASGFVAGPITYAPDVLTIAGNVSTQNPAAGSSLAPGSSVGIVISTGRAGLAVPDLIGLTQAAAITALTTVGLVPGSIGVVASTTVPAGIVISQNIGPGIPYPIFLAPGSLVGFVVSSGPPPTDTLFNYEPTVISQYANSPTLLQWLDNMNLYMDQSTNFANFLSYVWNVDSAVGFGLDIWGKIVNVSRLLRIPSTTPYVGFDIASESQPAQDWTPAGSNQPPYNNPPVGGAMYTGHNATEAYLLDDNAYRQLILAKAFANICSTTAPALNQILQNLYGAGQAYVLHSGVMAITYNFNFKPSPIQLAILQQSGVIPTPPGVAFSIVTP